MHSETRLEYDTMAVRRQFHVLVALTLHHLKVGSSDPRLVTGRSCSILGSPHIPPLLLTPLPNILSLARTIGSGTLLV